MNEAQLHGMRSPEPPSASPRKGSGVKMTPRGWGVAKSPRRPINFDAAER